MSKLSLPKEIIIPTTLHLRRIKHNSWRFQLLFSIIIFSIQYNNIQHRTSHCSLGRLMSPWSLRDQLQASVLHQDNTTCGVLIYRVWNPTGLWFTSSRPAARGMSDRSWRLIPDLHNWNSWITAAAVYMCVSVNISHICHMTASHM